MACRSHTGGQKYCTPPSLAGPARAAATRGIRRLLRFQGAFFCSSRANQGAGGTPPCLPYYGEQGRCKEKAGAVRNTGFGHGDSFLPVQGFCPCVRMRLCRAGGEALAGGAAACLPLRDGSPPLRPGAPGALAGAGRRAVLIRKGPRKTGALADVGLSGPQACAVPVRATSRKGDQPAGRPARRAPGSCRCCDRW